MTDEEIAEMKANVEAMKAQLQALAQPQPRQVQQPVQGESPLVQHFKKLPALDLFKLRNDDNANFIDALEEAVNGHFQVMAHHALEASHIQAKAHFAEFKEHIAPALQHATQYGEEQFFGSTYKDFDGLADYDSEFRSYIKANQDDPMAEQLRANPQLLRKHYAEGFVKANPNLAKAGLALTKPKGDDLQGGGVPPKSNFSGQAANHGGRQQRPAATATSGTGEVIPPSQRKADISLFSE